MGLFPREYNREYRVFLLTILQWLLDCIRSGQFWGHRTPHYKRFLYSTARSHPVNNSVPQESRIKPIVLARHRLVLLVEP